MGKNHFVFSHFYFIYYYYYISLSTDLLSDEDFFFEPQNVAHLIKTRNRPFKQLRSTKMV